MAVRVLSFGFKWRDPPPNARIFDCRKLPNPHHDPMLRLLNGKDKQIDAFVFSSDDAKILLSRAIGEAVAAGTIAFGCTGGRHRSVALAEAAARELRRRYLQVEVDHLDLDGG